MSNTMTWQPMRPVLPGALRRRRRSQGREPEERGVRVLPG